MGHSDLSPEALASLYQALIARKKPDTDPLSATSTGGGLKITTSHSHASAHALPPVALIAADGVDSSHVQAGIETPAQSARPSNQKLNLLEGLIMDSLRSKQRPAPLQKKPEQPLNQGQSSGPTVQPQPGPRLPPEGDYNAAVFLDVLPNAGSIPERRTPVIKSPQSVTFSTADITEDPPSWTAKGDPASISSSHGVVSPTHGGAGGGIGMGPLPGQASGFSATPPIDGHATTDVVLYGADNPPTLQPASSNTPVRPCELFPTNPPMPQNKDAPQSTKLRGIDDHSIPSFSSPSLGNPQPASGHGIDTVTNIPVAEPANDQTVTSAGDDDDGNNPNINANSAADADDSLDESQQGSSLSASASQ